MTTAKFKLQFFDSMAVVRAVDAGTRQALSRVGAFVRQRARRSMRKRKGSAEAGAPPSVHAGPVKDLLYFGFDPSSKSVVVGPVPFSNARGQDAVNRLEFGGDEQLKLPNGKTVTAHYQGNPFMEPALEAENDAGNIPPQWKDCVRGN